MLYTFTHACVDVHTYVYVQACINGQTGYDGQPALSVVLSLSLAVLIQLPGITGCAATAGAGLTLADYTAK